MSLSSSILARGDIVIAVFPFTDLSSSKRRPAVVLATAHTRPDLLLTFISSVIPTTVELTDLPILPTDADFGQSGLKVPSVIRLSKLATIERSLVTRRIGRLTAQRLLVLDDKLAIATGIELNRYLAQERQALLQLYNKQGIEFLLHKLRR